ncbi:MAG: ATP-binding protein [Oscillochloris sp.]|nr:ATP-binding protein [Oscillochloris sp.]
MKRQLHEYGLLLSDYGAFYGYRWLSWAVAGLSLTLPGSAAEDSSRQALLLLLLFAINIALTAVSAGYIRLARRRPAVLAIDLLIGCIVVWLSGGAALPFLPYALGALILPALLFHWRGALIGGLGFLVVDQAGLLLTLPNLEMSGFQTLGRMLIPIGFSLAWAAFGRLRDLRGLTSVQDDDPLLVQDTSQSGRVAGEAAPVLRIGERQFQRRLESPVADTPALRSPAPAGMTSAADLSPVRRAVYDLAPDPDSGLTTALERMAQWLEHECRAKVRLSFAGPQQVLSTAHHQVLLRTVQEAVLNIHQHAHARNVGLALNFEPRAVALSVQDDGVGLLDGTYERPGLHGLRLVRYRIAELDGQLAVFESENGGVTVRVTLPL